MKAQIKGLKTASANSQDGISLVQTAEGALTEVHDMLNRMVELAGKSANGILSRKAILRPIGSRHPNPKAAELELRLEEGLNRLGIGPQGLTGNSSVMGVHIESAARHPSTIGVAVSTGCWAHRRGTLLVHADLTFENLSHTRSAL